MEGPRHQHLHQERQEPLEEHGVRHGDPAHGAAAPAMKGIKVRSLAKRSSRRNNISQPQRRIVIREGASNETGRRR